MTEFIRNIIGTSEDVDDLDEVIEYLTSLASDEDTSVEDFTESLFGFFEHLEIDREKVVFTLDQIRNPSDNTTLEQPASISVPEEEYAIESENQSSVQSSNSNLGAAEEEENVDKVGQSITSNRGAEEVENVDKVSQSITSNRGAEEVENVDKVGQSITSNRGGKGGGKNQSSIDGCQSFASSNRGATEVEVDSTSEVDLFATIIGTHIDYNAPLDSVYMEPVIWACKVCTFENSVLMPTCEICGGNAPPPKLPPKVKPTKEETEELKKELPTKSSLNSVLQGDVQRRRRRDNEEEYEKLLEVLVDAKVADAEHCRKLLDRQKCDKMDDYSLVELIGFGLSSSDAKLLFEHVQSLNEKPELEFDDKRTEGQVDASPSEINELMFLIPDRIINRSQVEYVYFVLSRKSVVNASLYLVENFVEVCEPRLSANVRKIIDDAGKWWEMLAKPKVDEKEVSNKVKEGLMRRFDERPDDSKVTHRPCIASGGGSTGKKTSAIRYMDGNKVTMKSAKDKFIIEDSTVEWDGGSRGKVKSKGKRGPAP